MSNRTKLWTLIAAASLAVTTGITRAEEPADTTRPVAVERFVPRIGTSLSGAGTLEVRQQTTAGAEEITIRHLCRWSNEDAAAFAGVADLVVDRFDAGETTRMVPLDKIQTVLRQAGSNLGTIHFTGSTECVAVRGAAMRPTAKPVEVGNATPVPAATEPVAPVEAALVHTLKSRLIDDLTEKLNVTADQLQVSFGSLDANTLNLAEPTFQFEIQQRSSRDLGRITWDVIVMTGKNRQHLAVTADVRMWEQDVVMTRPVGRGQTLRAGDVKERRVLVTQLPEDPLLTRDQAIGQLASRPLKPGTVLTGRLVDPVEMVSAGQDVTVTIIEGGVQVTTVAKAIDGGTIGQVVHVRNPETRDVFEVTVTGKCAGTMGVTDTDADVATVKE